jgi:hypothetical protein
MMKLAALFLFIGASFAEDPIGKAGDTLCGESICVRAAALWNASKELVLQAIQPKI